MATASPIIGHMRLLWQSLQLALWPRRCGACLEVLCGLPQDGLCVACRASLQPNLGPRCSLCDCPSTRSMCAACLH
ncbi:MAG: hypothetical protein EOO40_03340, partial [Deltaproteobacteria bacterium]